MQEFNVRLNGITILQEFTMWHHQPLGTTFDIHVNFRVSKNGDKMTMKLHGWDEVDIEDGIILFELCSSMCPPKQLVGFDTTFPMNLRRHFYIAALSVLKFKTYKN